MSRVFNNCSLKNYSTFRIGGNCRKLTEVYNEEDMLAAYEKDSVVIGKGSNILFSDKFLDRDLIVNGIGGFSIKDDTFTAGSGVCFNSVISNLAAAGCGGMEWAVNIPGTLGGAVVMNAGAFGACVADSLVRIRALIGGRIEVIAAKDLELSYRKSKLPEGAVIVDATFRCRREDEDVIRGNIDKFKTQRKSLQPVGMSVGSVFLKADKPAGYYIDQAGLKGRAVGGAYVSEKHANFIINRGFARAEDVTTLIKVVKAGVYDRFKIKLREEIKYIGEF